MGDMLCLKRTAIDQIQGAVLEAHWFALRDPKEDINASIIGLTISKNDTKSHLCLLQAQFSYQPAVQQIFGSFQREFAYLFQHHVLLEVQNIDDGLVHPNI